MDWSNHPEPTRQSSSVSASGLYLPHKRQKTAEATEGDHDTTAPRSIGNYTAPSRPLDLSENFTSYQDQTPVQDFVEHDSDASDGRESPTAHTVIEEDEEDTNEDSEEDTTMSDTHSAHSDKPTGRPSSHMSYDGAETNEGVLHDEDSDDDVAESAPTMDFADPDSIATANSVDEAEESDHDEDGSDVSGDDDDGEENGDDLFSTTFGRKKTCAEGGHEVENDDRSSSSSTSSSSEDGDVPRPQRKNQAHSHEQALNQAEQHPDASTATKTTSTTTKPPDLIKTPTTASKSTTTPPSTTIPPLSPLLKAQTKFHITALSYLPKLPLASHRYWLGILHVTKTPRTARSESDFVWLKGNRFTTIRTLKNAYATMSARSKEDFELRLEGFGRVREAECVEELAILGDKKVFFWAVEKIASSSGGKKEKGKGKADGFGYGVERAWEVSRGLVPSSSAVMTANGGVGGKTTEVIELD